MSIEHSCPPSSLSFPPRSEIDVAQQASGQLLREFERALATRMAVSKREHGTTIRSSTEPGRKRRKVIAKQSQQPFTVHGDVTGSKITRFSSEEVDSTPLNPEAENQPRSAMENKENIVGESDDEAPEEVHVANHEDKIGLAATKAAAEAAKQATMQREKRRQHEDRMREQARQARKAEIEPRQSASDIMQPQESMDPDATRQATESQARLPALLPEELLNAEPTVTKDTWISSVKKDLAKDKRKTMLDRRDALPKDLFRGNTRIRVVSSEPTSLAPKANVVGKKLRESWLIGQRGPNQADWKPRMRASSGFVRKPR